MIDQYFDRLNQIMSRPDLPARIRFMMQDVEELRQHKVEFINNANISSFCLHFVYYFQWVPRKHIRDVGPKTIYQIRQEVWQVINIWILLVLNN